MSTLGNISSVDMLECLITKDPRWSWVLDTWEESDDEQLLNLAETVHRFRANFVKETAGLVSKLLGDIKGPDDVKKYTERAASEGIDTREPEPEA
eukprot:COSAG02_NODE_1620_length_11617_cov_3.185275_1_plen_95_part_00